VVEPEDCNGGANLEIWEIAFDDPTDADTPMTAVGGVGNSQGYVFRRAGGRDLPACGAWTQQRGYQFVDSTDPNHVNVCGISTLYSADILDTSVDEVVVAGYAGHLFHFEDSALPNFDTPSCVPCPPGTCTAGETWVQVDTVAKDPADPQMDLAPPFGNNAALLGGARVNDDAAVLAGHFGVITRYDRNATQQVTEAGARWALRITDGHFEDASSGVVVGQQGVVLRTFDGGLSWDPATVSWAVPTAADPGLADVAWLNAVSFSGVGGRAVTVGTGGHIGLSADGGISWTEPDPADLQKSGTSFTWQDLGAAAVEEHLRDVEQLGDGAALRIGGENGAVLFRDAGVWTRVRSRPTQRLVKLSFLSQTQGFAIGRRSLILTYGM